MGADPVERALEAWPGLLAQRKTMPSRGFLIGQSCLDAACDESMGVRGRPHLAAAWLRGRTFGGTHLPDGLAELVRLNFSARVRSHGGTTCP